MVQDSLSDFETHVGNLQQAGEQVGRKPFGLSATGSTTYFCLHIDRAAQRRDFVEEKKEGKQL